MDSICTGAINNHPEARCARPAVVTVDGRAYCTECAHNAIDQAATQTGRIGWGYAQGSHRTHYFRDGLSLCNSKIDPGGPLSPEPGDNPCQPCQTRLQREPATR